MRTYGTRYDRIVSTGSRLHKLVHRYQILRLWHGGGLLGLWCLSWAQPPFGNKAFKGCCIVVCFVTTLKHGRTAGGNAHT